MDDSRTLDRAFLQSLQEDASHSRGSLEKIIESLALGCLFLLSFFANGTICTILLQQNRRQTVSNILLLSLVFSNFLITVLVLPFVIASVIADDWVFKGVWCEVSGFLVTCLTTASTTCIAAIAIHRYYIVVKPLALKIDLQRANCIVGFLWFSAAICAVPPLFGWNSYVYSAGKAGCTLWWRSSGAALGYTMYYATVTFVTPLLIIILVYRAIYRKAKRQRKLDTYLFNGMNGHVGPSRSEHGLRMCKCLQSCTLNNYPSSSSFYDPSPSIMIDRNIKVSRHSSVIQQRTFQSVSAIVVSFVVCLSPYFVFNIWTSFQQTATPYGILDFCTTWLYLSMTAINPMTYGYSNRQMRRAVKRLPLIRRIFKQGRDRAYQMDPSVFTVPRRHLGTSSQSNDALELSERS